MRVGGSLGMGKSAVATSLYTRQKTQASWLSHALRFLCLHSLGEKTSIHNKNDDDDDDDDASKEGCHLTVYLGRCQAL